MPGVSPDTATQNVRDVHDTEVRLPPLSTRSGADHDPFRIMAVPLSPAATQNCESGHEIEVGVSSSIRPSALQVLPSKFVRMPLPRPAAHDPVPPQEIATGPLPGEPPPGIGIAGPHCPPDSVTELPRASIAVQVEEEGQDTSTSADPLATTVGPDHFPAIGVVLVQALKTNEAHETSAMPAREQYVRAPVGPDRTRRRTRT